ncbi:biotin--[acetyl-CoA-carboxylase] ligase [Candidatus Omnitrophota bacterium]
MLHTTIKNKLFSEYGKYICTDDFLLPWLDLDTINSTMETAHELVREGCPPWITITARHQSSGRGTHGRSWSSQAGKGLWMSVILPPPVEAENLSGLSILIAEVLVSTLREFADCPFMIKHPNDVTVNGRKIAGILLESATEHGCVTSVILGLGVNFHQTHDDFLEDDLPEATSLDIETGHAPDRDTFLKVLIKQLHSTYEKFLTNFSSGVYRDSSL